MNRFTRWWNKDKIAYQNMQDEIDKIKSLASDLSLRNTKLQEQLDEYQLEKTRQQERYHSNEPWVEIKGDHIDPERGIEIELDWNPAFIAYLEDHGITGASEDIVIRKYLSLLYAQLSDKIEDKIVDESDITKPSEFE